MRHPPVYDSFTDMTTEELEGVLVMYHRMTRKPVKAIERMEEYIRLRKARDLIDPPKSPK